jgi:hypothetical protein
VAVNHALKQGGIVMNQPKRHVRYSVFNFFSFALKTPEQILVETQWTTVVVLVGVALYAHNPLPLFPAAVLLMGLYGYSSRRAALAETASAFECDPALSPAMPQAPASNEG